MNLKPITPIAAAVGLAFAGSVAASNSDLFVLNDLGHGYALVGDEGKNAEGKCGEGKCGEGKCGIDKLDTDKDGKVSRAEFQAAGKPIEKFDEIDADKDGFITQEEAEAYHAAHGDHGKKDGEGKCGEGKCGEGKCGGAA